MNNDLISREDLKKAIDDAYEEYDGYDPHDLSRFAERVDDLIDNAPTVDTTEEYLKGYLQGCEDTVKKVNELQKIQVHIPYGRGTKMERSDEE